MAVSDLKVLPGQKGRGEEKPKKDWENNHKINLHVCLVQIVAASDLKAGQEIFNTYGE